MKRDYEYIPWHMIDECVAKIVTEIKEANVHYDALYGLPRGGLPAAVMFSHRLAAPLLLAHDDAYLYRKEGKRVLIVDDISDSGKALKRFKEDGFDIATLYIREHTTKTIPKYHGIAISHDRWLVFPWEIVEEE